MSFRDIVLGHLFLPIFQCLFILIVCHVSCSYTHTHTHTPVFKLPSGYPNFAGVVPQYLLTVSLFLISTLLPGVAFTSHYEKTPLTSPPRTHQHQTHTHTLTHTHTGGGTENSVNPQASSCLSSLDVLRPKLFQYPCAICQKSFL